MKHIDNFIVFLFIFSGALCAQELPNVISPSPSVASLMHFEEVPVDYYSGQPNIQFPIFSKSLGGNLNIPLVLRYNTMGLRVDERSGWVGKGWALDGEIIISRTVRGIRDEAMLNENHPQNTSFQVGVHHNGFFELDFQQPGIDDFQDIGVQRFLWNASGKGSGRHGFAGDGAYDKEPDLYQLSLIGQSARFFLARTGNTLEVRMLSNDSNLKVIPNYDSTSFAVNYFTVIDTNGINYILDVIEETTNNSSTGIIPQYSNEGVFTNESVSNFVSAWKVKSIYSENNELLATYSYSPIYESYQQPISVSEATIRTQTVNDLSIDFFFGENGGQVGVGNHNQFHEANRSMAIPKRTINVNQVSIVSQKLSSIYFRDNSHIDFILGNQPHPEYGSNSILHEIKIYDQDNSLHKSFDFIFNITNNKPLFLDAVDEYYANGKKLSYGFEYTDKNSLPIANSLPFGNAGNKDNWGYYKETDNSLGPIIYKLPAESADKDAVTTGSLKSINYPTSGKKVFEFESNTLSHRGARPFTDAEFKMFNKDNWNLGANLSNARVEFNNVDQNPPAQSISNIFTLSEQQKIEFIPTITYQGQNNNYNGVGNDSNSNEDTTEDYIRDIAIELHQLQNNGNYETVDVFSFLTRKTTQLLPGTYRLKYISLNIGSNNQPSHFLKAKGVLYYKTYKDNIDKVIYGGGLRIKSIKFLDRDASIKKDIRYDYNESDSFTPREPIISSGVIDGFLKNYKEYIMPKTSVFTQFTGGGGNSMQYTAYPTTLSYLIKDYLNGTNTSLTKGNYVGYRKVKMYQVSSGLSNGLVPNNNGSTEFIYTTPADHPTQSLVNGWPFIPEKDQSHLHGLLLSQRVYNKEGLILADTKNTYYDPIEESQGIYLHLVDDPSCYWANVYERYDNYLNKTIDRPEFSETLHPGDNCTTPLNDQSIETYDVPVFKWTRDLLYTKVLLKDTKTKTYFYSENGEQRINISKEEYIYEPQNWQIKQKVSTISENNQDVNYRTEFTYPVGNSNTENNVSIINSLINSNKINEVIGTKSFRNDEQLSETQTIYGMFSNQILPSTVRVGKGTDDLTDRIHFYEYDNFGNPLEMSKSDDVHVNYLWGYDNTLPVAKIVNTNRSEIVNALGNNLNIDNGLSTVQRLNLRTSLPQAEWNFYEYDPMVGISKTYDSRGNTMAYAYDDYYRLLQVKDNEGYILSKNEYHYGTDNYVKTTAYQTKTLDGINNAVSSGVLLEDDKLESITYMDGLGRSIQSINKQFGGDKQDIIATMVYDDFGRQSKEYLPYADQNNIASLDFRDQNQLLNDLENYYRIKYPNDKIDSQSINAYSEKVFEESPVSRVIEQAAPGKDWFYNVNNVTYSDVSTTIEHAMDDVSINLTDAMFKEVNIVPLDNYDIEYVYSSIGELNIISNVLTVNLNSGTYNALGNNRKLGNITYINSGLHTLNGIVVADLSHVNAPGIRPYTYLEINDGYLQIVKSINQKTVDAISSGDSYSYTIPSSKPLTFSRRESNNHTIKFSYDANTDNEVKAFSVNHPNSDTEKTELVFNGTYSEGELTKTITKDENWVPASGNNHTTEEFKNTQGQVLLKRTYNNNEAHDTYYVYDDYGNLTYVLSPEASDEILLIEASNSFTAQSNFSWVDLVQVDSRFAEEYNRNLRDYDNADILNVDLQNEYGGQGGFTVSTINDGEDVVLSISFSTIKELELRKGRVVDLNEFGNFKNTELGRVSGNGYDYTFYIRDNVININGGGKLFGINETFNSTAKLEYDQNYLWTKYIIVPENFASSFEKQVIGYAKQTNQNPLNVYIENEFGGQGGLNITIDSDDNIALTFNSSVTTPLTLKQGVILNLNTQRLLTNRPLGTISGPGFSYDFSLQDNNIVVSGSGEITSFNGFIFSNTEVADPVINTLVLEGLSYIYHYDGRNRLIEKKIPGKDWEHIIYDKLDRPILTQDGNLRLQDQWLFTKYDAFGRVAYTGLWEQTDAPERKILQNTADASNLVQYEQRQNTTIANTAIDYTNSAFPNSNIAELYTLNYYDDYDALDISGAAFNKNAGDMVYNTAISMATKSLPTISKVKVLTTDQWITSVSYYDALGRPLYNASNNAYLYTTDIMESKLDFTGKVLKTKSTHTAGSNSPIVVEDTFSYDHAGRLLTQTQTLNNTSHVELIVNNHYDELGQLVTKDVGGDAATQPENSQGLQSVDYSYNIRGWLKTINNGVTANGDLFGFKLTYNDPDQGAAALYNGNISETYWQTANDNTLRSYDYSYDALNRIEAANYKLVGSTVDIENYNLSHISYDKNGNINALKRKGLKLSNNTYDIIDDLSYSYQPLSNKLLAVHDDGTTDGFKDNATSTENDYLYDINGNMIEDQNKGITSIEYNHLNLPTKVRVASENHLGSLIYFYDANGVKLSKQSNVGNSLNGPTTEYAGNYIYKRNNISASPKLKMFFQPEGYVEPNGEGVFNYVYQYKDHLGNIRLTYADSDKNGSIDSTTEIISEKNYYPFGMTHKGYNNVISANANSTAKRFGFAGKESNEELGLDWYDFGARNYDSSLGRWMNLDPLAEKMRRFSPYNYAFGNPIYWIDPDGMEPMDEWNRSADGVLTWVSDAGGDNIDYVNNLNENGDVVSTDEMEVITMTSTCNGCDRNATAASDAKAKSPGVRQKTNAVSQSVESMSIFDMAPTAVEALTVVISNKLGIDPSITSALSLFINPKKATKKINQISTKGKSKGSISATKDAVTKAKKKIGLDKTETLPKSKGKFGSPQRGDSKKGYRLDPAHPNAKPGSGEEYPHVNYWDYTKGKKGKGGVKGAEPIKD